MTYDPNDLRRPHRLDDPDAPYANSPPNLTVQEAGESSGWAWVAGIVGFLAIVGLLLWGTADNTDRTAMNADRPTAPAPSTTGAAPPPEPAVPNPAR